MTRWPPPRRRAAAGLSTGRDRRRPGLVPRRRPATRAQGRATRHHRARRLRPPPHRDPRHAGRGPPALSRPARVGRLRAAHLPPHGGHARGLRRRAGHGRPGRHRRHLGQSRPDRTITSAQALADATTARARRLAGHGTRLAGGHRRSPRRPGRAGRRGAGHGRRPVLRHRRAPDRAAGREPGSAKAARRCPPARIGPCPP